MKTIINNPKIKQVTDSTFTKLMDENDFNNFRFNKNVDEKIIIKDITIDSCIFEKIDFSNIEYHLNRGRK